MGRGQYDLLFNPPAIKRELAGFGVFLNIQGRGVLSDQPYLLFVGEDRGLSLQKNADDQKICLRDFSLLREKKE